MLDRFGQRRHGQRPPHQLSRVFGEINAALIAIAIGLAVLDYVFFLHGEITAALPR